MTSPQHLPHLKSARGFTFDIVGEAHYQAALDHICGGKTERGHKLEIQAALFPEDDNPHDANAVGVYIEGRQVGHLPREACRQFREVAPVGAVCRAKIVGGWTSGGDDGFYGVKLKVAHPFEQDTALTPVPAPTRVRAKPAGGCAGALVGLAVLAAIGTTLTFWV